MTEIRKKIYFSTLAATLYIGLSLFLSAGSFKYWQGWIFLIAFLLPTLLISIHFLKKNPSFMKSRLTAGPWAEKEKSQKIIQSFSGFFFFCLLIFPGLDYRFHLSRVSVLLTVFGDTCIIVGFYIVFLAFRENSYASGIIETKKKQTVISTGLYRHIRHPMYAGVSLVVGAIPLALGSYWAWIYVMCMGVFLVLRILHEETYLEQWLRGYTAYRKMVRYRLIPYIW